MVSLDQARDRVLAYIDSTASDLTAFLQRYVQFRSINPDLLDSSPTTELRHCQEWLADTLQTWNVFEDVALLAKDPEQPNVVARHGGTGTERALLFNGHTDVVPVTDDQAANWSLGTPWGGTIVDGKLTGRGASDMKGGNAAFLWAIKALADCDIALKGDLLATVVSGEETGSHAIGVDLLADAGYVAPFAILAEPTSLDICPASVGEFYFKIRVTGRSTSLANRHLSVHPAPHGVPVAGVNAIDKMWRIQRALADLEREWGIWQRHPLMAPGNMNINISQISGGATYSSLADTCEMTGSVLFNPALQFAEVRAEFERAIESVVQTDYWLREHPPILTIPYVLDAKEPINVSPDHPGCEALIEAYRQVLGEDPPVLCTTFTSDGNYLFARGQTIITCGPGGPDAGVHGANEYIDVAELIAATKMYACMAINWSGVTP